MDYCSSRFFDPSTLRSLALTCRSLHRQSLLYLYQGAELNGEHRLRRLTETLQARPDLAQNFSSMTHTVCGKKHPYHIVPLLLIGLRSPGLRLQTVKLSASGASTHGRLGRETHDSFLKSYIAFRSISTLELNFVSFDTFSYFARLLLSFRSLRRLDMEIVIISKLDRYPVSIARQRHLQLHSLKLERINAEFLLRFAPWLISAGALQSIEELSIVDPSFYGTNGPDGAMQPVPKIGPCISLMLRAAGKRLQDLVLSTEDGASYFACDSVVNLQFSKSLNRIRCQGLTASAIEKLLPSLRSNNISSLDLTIEVHEEDKVHSLSNLLISLNSSFLHKAQVKVHYTKGRGWDWYRSTKDAVDKCMEKLEDAFGDRMECIIKD